MKIEKKYIYSLFVSLVWFLGFSQIELPPDDDCVVYYVDNDRDGYGGSTQDCLFGTVPHCLPSGSGPCYSTMTGDCNDNDNTIYPKLWYRDNDGDTFGAGAPYSLFTRTCNPPLVSGNWVSNNSDCNDSPGYGWQNPNTIWYADIDNDGLGDPLVTRVQCTKPSDAFYVTNNLDRCPTEFGLASQEGCPNLSDENYIYTRDFQRPYTNLPQTFLSGDIVESVTYFDGQGRPKQEIAIRQSPNGKNISINKEYDNFGNEPKTYLNYQPSTTISINGRYISHSLAKTGTQQFYQTKYNDSIAYSEVLIDKSNSNRILTSAAPGQPWKLGSGNEIKMELQTNVPLDNVVRFNVDFYNNSRLSTKLIKMGLYDPNQLIKTIIKNENWKSNQIYLTDNTVEEFKDKSGRIILKRTYNLGQLYNTYLVYNDFGNLTYVLPPQLDTYSGALISATMLDDLAYQYVYDDKNRLVEKKLPGKGSEYIIYDKLNRPILTQDANLRADKKWLFTKYDAFNRPVYTGEYTNTAGLTRSAAQAMVDGFSILSETKQTTVTTLNGTSLNYSNLVFPTLHNGTTSIINLFTINYYDSYTSCGITPGATGSTENAYGIVPIINAKGLGTCSKVRVLGTNSWITNITYYDGKARPIFTCSINDYLGTLDKVYSQLDFVGKITENTTTHNRSSVTTTIVDTFTYDVVGRLLTQKQKINNQLPQDQQLIVSNSYDEVGKLISKEVGGKISLTRLQKIDYTYNIRGWLKSINDVNAIGNDLFAFQINYNDPTAGGVPLYNGNISQTLWKTANTDSSLKNYVYTYDALNRLKDATDNLGRYNENLDYNKNGNIIKLLRSGNTVPNTTNFGPIDNLTYTYDTGNKLNKVEDSVANSEGFNNGASGALTDYTYDANGNMKTDLNKGITAIAYNHLNLPTQVTIGGASIIYVYDATGKKLRKTVNSVITDYAGKFIYQGITLQFFSQPEGYVANNSGTFDYIYQYKDHLGNIRLSYQDKGNDAMLNSTDIVEENNYYPFGLKHKGNNTSITSTNLGQKYKYNGKELQDELGLNVYDYGARNYDPALGRWMNIDPKAEQSRRWTPYNYAYNNPMYFVDPDGMQAEGATPPDWFVNNKTGAVVHVEGKSTLSQETATSIGAGDASDYDRLGADNMFGDKVAYGTDSNIRDNGPMKVENPEKFMKNQGYVKANELEMKETTHVNGGSMGAGENIVQTSTVTQPLSEPKITYAKPNDLNKKTDVMTTPFSGRYSNTETTTYTTKMPFNQKSSSTNNSALGFAMVPLQILSDLLTEFIESKK